MSYPASISNGLHSSSTDRLGNGYQSYTAATPNYASYPATPSYPAASSFATTASYPAASSYATTPSYATYQVRPAESYAASYPSAPLPSRVAAGEAPLSYGEAQLVNVNATRPASRGSPSRIVKGAGYVAAGRPAASGAYYTGGGGYSERATLYGGNGYASYSAGSGVYAGAVSYAAGERVSYDRPGCSYRVLSGPAIAGYR